MSYCLNPNCKKPENLDGNKFCQGCGSKLLLNERYRPLKQIGQGGFGRTFLAVDCSVPSEPRCVIKQLLPEKPNSRKVAKATERFEKEVSHLEQLGKHPQIPELLDRGQQDDYQYLVQEFIEGDNLAEELKQDGVFTETKIEILLNDLLPVLQFIHDAGVIHRDIKPQNIIRRDRDGQFVLVDLGAAKLVTGTAMVKTGTSIGTPAYVAPEQAKGKAVFASDLYSLGVTCIHLMTQTPPFELFNDREDTWIWRQYLGNNPVSDRLGSILDKMLERATKRRYKSAKEVLNDLNSTELPNPLQPEETESSKKAGLYWTLESLEVYQQQFIHKRIFPWSARFEQPKILINDIYGFLEKFAKQELKQPEVSEEEILLLWKLNMVELVNSFPASKEMQHEKDKILGLLSQIASTKDAHQRDEKLEAISRQLLLVIFEESNAEGKFTNVISKNSETYQIQLTEQERQKAAKGNILGASVVVALVGFASSIATFVAPESTMNIVEEPVKKIGDVVKVTGPPWLLHTIKAIQAGVCNTTGQLCNGENTELANSISDSVSSLTTLQQQGLFILEIILCTTVLAGIVFGIRYKKTLNKLAFVQSIFSIYSYKYQNGLEES